MSDNSLRHWTRIKMFEEGVRLIKTLGPSIDVVEVSGDNWGHLLPWVRSFRSVHPLHYDICKGPVPGPTGDVIIVDQVLEHVLKPVEAAANIRRSMSFGGAAFFSTPFLIRRHPDPVDLWRWTEDGLRSVMVQAGFGSVVTGSWGNRACVIANLDEWADYDPLNHSLENEPNFPVTVWAFCRV